MASRDYSKFAVSFIITQLNSMLIRVNLTVERHSVALRRVSEACNGLIVAVK